MNAIGNQIGLFQESAPVPRKIKVGKTEYDNVKKEWVVSEPNICNTRFVVGPVNALGFTTDKSKADVWTEAEAWTIAFYLMKSSQFELERWHAVPADVKLTQ